MSIGKRLALLVIVTLLGLAISGGHGVFQLKGLQQHFDEVNERSVPSLMAMSQISDQFKEVRALLLALLMEEDVDLQKAFAQKVTETRNALKSAVDEYGKTPGAEASAEALAPIAQKYSQAVDAVLAVADKKDLAQVELYTKVVPAEQAFTAFIDQAQAALAENQKHLRSTVATEISRGISVYVVVIGLVALVVAGLGFALHRSVMSSLNGLIASMKQVATHLDFRQRVEVKSQDEVAMAVTTFNTLLDTVQASLREIAGSMEALRESTGRMTQTSREIQSISEQTSASASAVSSTVQQVTNSIGHVATQTEQAETLSRESGEQAATGGAVIQNTIEQIGSIAGTVHSAAEDIAALRGQIGNISSVVGVIREVADQTNLLALNAAIEAARAGEQGRGFAVVADEVRKLAERTASSTQEISGLIQSIQQSATTAVETMQVVVARVEEGMGSANTAIDALSGIRASSDKVVCTVAEIASAIREQSSATSYIAEEFQRIASISAEARHALADTTQSTQELEALAIRVNDAVQRYRI